MSEPSVLEHCRMALAEIGRPVDCVTVDHGRLIVEESLPVEERWLLECVIGEPGDLWCLPCYVALDVVMSRMDRRASQEAAMDAAFAACRADRPFQRQSCGAAQ